MGYSVLGVDFGGSAGRKDLYTNKRVEMYCLAGEWMENGGALPDDKDLCQELAAPVLLPSQTEKKRMEPKAKLKERLGRSPDKADAFVMTFAMPVRPKSHEAGAGYTIKTTTSSNYNPLNKKGSQNGTPRSQARRYHAYGALR